MNKFWKRKRGFTFIELLVVIALLGILVLIAIPHFYSVRTGVPAMLRPNLLLKMPITQPKHFTQIVQEGL